jgi:anti-sigma B factor antagonist
MPLVDNEAEDGLLTVQQTGEGDRVRLALRGELDLSNAPTAEAGIKEAFASGKDVLIDLGPLEFIDSTGIALIVMAMGREDARRLTFLPSRSDTVRRLLNLTGLDEKMPLSVTADSPPVLPA